MKKNILLGGLLAALVLPAADLSAVQVIGGPDYFVLSSTSVQIQWFTDLPSDSKVNYGTNYIYDHTVYSSTPTTNHVMTLSGLANGGVYDYMVSSTIGPQTTEEFNWLVLPPEMAVFQWPDMQSVVSSNVWLKVRTADTSIQVEAASFYYFDPASGQPVLIGTDSDGTDVSFNTFQPGPTGDGWSAYWNTMGLPEGSYSIMAQLFSSPGTLTATSVLYVDQSPPTPALVVPRFSDVVVGKLQLQAQGGQGTQAVFDVQQVLATVISFNPVPLAQTNYPYDGFRGTNGGRMMCDPTSEGAVFLSDAYIVNWLRTHPPCQTNANPDQCIRNLLIRFLAQRKGTGRNGTQYDHEAAGTDAVIAALGLVGTNAWTTAELPTAFNGYGVPRLKQALRCNDRTKASKGMIVHIARCNNPGATGHVMALVSVDDTPNRDGSYNLQFMDPATGATIQVTMDRTGQFSYPPGPNGQCCLVIGARTWCGPPAVAPHVAAKASLTPDWQVIGTATNGLNGWSVVWDTSTFLPSLYWVRVTVTDGLGHTGQDQVEAFVVPVLSISKTPANVTLSWPAVASNWVLQAVASLSASNNWLMVTNPVVGTNGQSTVTDDPSGKSRFYRLTHP